MKRIDSRLLFRSGNNFCVLSNRRRMLRSYVPAVGAGPVNLNRKHFNPSINDGASSTTILQGTSWKNTLEYATACYRAGSEETLNIVVSLAKKDCEKRTNTANRLLYMALDMALNQNRMDVAEDLCKLLPRHVHVLATSLRVRFLIRQERFWDALNEIEKVLNEDTANTDISKKISNSVLDEFFEAISSREDMLDEAKRLFTLQRLLSRFNKRTKKTVTELLFSDIDIEPVRGQMESLKIDDSLLNKIVKHVAEILTDDKR